MNNIDHETMKYLLKYKVDLFAFMNLSNRFTEDQYFTTPYMEALKRHYRKNCKIYHPDKLRNASVEEQTEQTFKFSLNSAIYRILSDKELLDEYKKSTELIGKTNIELKEDYKNTRDEIAQMITNISKKKSYEEVAREKEQLHGISRENTIGNASQFKDKEIDIATFTKMISIYESDREEFTNALQNEHDKNKAKEYDEKIFNKEFDNALSVDVAVAETTIVPFCEISGTLTTAFDYEKQSYDTLYVSASDGNQIDKSFELPSANIDRKKQINDKINFEDAIKRYQLATIELGDIVKKSKKNTDTIVDYPDTFAN